MSPSLPTVDVAPYCFDFFSPYFAGYAFCFLGVPQSSLAKILHEEYTSPVADTVGALAVSSGSQAISGNLMVSYC